VVISLVSGSAVAVASSAGRGSRRRLAFDCLGRDLSHGGLIQLAAEKLEVPLLARGDGDLDWSAIAKRAADDAGVGHG